MLFYNLRIVLKDISRFRSHNVISITGLAISLACLFVMGAWAIQELQYDRFHKDSELIFMVTTQMSSENGTSVTIAETPTALASELKNRIPSVEESFNFLYLYGKRVLQVGDRFYEETGVAAKPTMLDVFNFPLVNGLIDYLDDPDCIFITEKLGKKLFADESPLGKVIKYNNAQLLTVRGILKDIPENSSLKFDFIIPKQIESDNNAVWMPLSTNTIIKVAPKTNITDLKKAASAIWRENIEYEQLNIDLLPITKLRYGADFDVFNAKHGNYWDCFIDIDIGFSELYQPDVCLSD